jgi:integrase
VARLHAVIRRALNEAMRLDLIPRNPATLVTAPRQPRKEQQVLTPDQARVLLHAIEGHPLQAFFTLLTMTGMRRGEALALHWADVHLEEGYADVKYTLEHGKGGIYIFAPPKTDRSRRCVPLNASRCWSSIAAASRNAAPAAARGGSRVAGGRSRLYRRVR